VSASNRTTRRLLRKRAIRAMRAAFGVNRAQARLLAYKPQSTEAKALNLAILDAISKARSEKEATA
jgi:hypothetical protein